MARVRRESVRGPSSFCVHFLGEPGVALSLALSTLAPRPRLPPRPRHLPALLLTLEAGSCLPAALLTPPEWVTKLFK